MINYFEAAEKTLRARGLLETALGNLERKKERILRYGAPSEYPSADMSKPYTGAKSVNDALADCLELAEVMREIQVTRDKVEEIDDVLAQMDEDDARILRLWYIERKSKDEITEAVCYSDTVVYVRLHENGCYVPCDEAEAGGFCIKTAIDRKDEETGETTTYLEDFVYAFADGGLLGIEPVGSVENVSGTLMLAENDKVLDILLGGAAE